MSNQKLFIYMLVLFIASSCKKDDNTEPAITDSDYPVSLGFNMIDYSGGIYTYTINGKIETPDYFREQMLSIDTNKRVFSDVLIKSQNSAQFIFTEIADCDEDCLNGMNNLFKELGIKTRNDTIIFTLNFNYEDVTFNADYPSIGSLAQELKFCHYTMMSVKNNGNNFSTLTLEAGMGVKDYSKEISTLREGDTLALMEYYYTYRRK